MSNIIANCIYRCGVLVDQVSDISVVACGYTTAIWLIAKVALPELGYTAIRGIPVAKISKCALWVSLGIFSIGIAGNIAGNSLIALGSILGASKYSAY